MRIRPTLLLLTGLLAAGLGASATELPAHVKLANKMIAEIQPENNRYKNGKATVTWAGVDGATLTKNESDCTTYVTALLHTAYGFTSRQFESWFGKGSPSIGMYYDSAVDNKGLHGFKKIADLKPGDLLISKYTHAAQGGAAGHMMIVAADPVATTTGGSGLHAYNITIIDCSGSPHFDDTRGKKGTADETQTGIGRGTMQVYVDSDGNIAAWSWSAGKKMQRYTPDARPLIFAKIPTTSK